MTDEKNGLSKTKPAELAVVQPQSEYNNFVEYANKELTCEIICKTNCKLCISPHRTSAEEEYAKSANILKVHRRLADDGEQISYNAVRNHLLVHYRRPELEERLRDYANDIHSWSKIRQEKEEMHRGHISILQRRIMLIEAMTDDMNSESQRKTADSVAKLIDQIGKEQERLEKLRNDESPIKILFLKFEDMVKIKLENMTSADARVALVDILENFASIVSEFENGD